MEFKKLELEKDSSWFKRNLWSAHAKKTILYAVVGAMAGGLYFFFSEGQNTEIIVTGDMLKSILVGAGFGLFLTNSPCARGRC